MHWAMLLDAGRPSERLRKRPRSRRIGEAMARRLWLRQAQLEAMRVEEPA